MVVTMYKNFGNSSLKVGDVLLIDGSGVYEDFVVKIVEETSAYFKVECVNNIIPKRRVISEVVKGFRYTIAKSTSFAGGKLIKRSKSHLPVYCLSYRP